MPLASALCQPDDQEDPALQAIAELIAAECNSPGSARHIASTILEFERNEIAQREFFMSCCLETQGLPAGAQLVAAVRQHYPEYDMLQELIHEELEFKSRPDKRWIAKGMKVMQKMQLEFIHAHQQEQTDAVKRWKSSLRYMKRAANQLVKALRADTRSQP